ncbi:MAG: TolC family protein [Pseudomonadota bacterium]
MNIPPWTSRGARRHLSRLVLCAPLVCGALNPSSAYAQPTAEAAAVVSTGAAPVTLKQAVEAALARLPQTHAADVRRDAAAARLSAAGSWTPEPIALELSAKSDRLQTDQGDREWVAGIAAPLWLPGQRDGTIAVADAARTAIDSQLDAVRWRAAATVREAWWAVQGAREAQRTAQSRVDHAQQLAADVTRRVRAGDLSRADQHQADGALAAAQAEFALAQSAASRAAQSLRALTGLPVATALDVRGEAVPALAADAALLAHPALRELADKAEVARRTRDLAGIEKRANPELTLATSRERGGAGEPYARALTIGVRIPFGSSDRHAARLAEASADQTEAEIALMAERERIAADIASARDQLAAAEVVAKAAARRAVLAREARGFYEKSFRLGETDLPNRLRIDLEDMEAERQSARARVDLSAATSQLRQALGLLPE